MRKRISAILLTAVVVLAMMPLSAFAATSDPVDPGTEEKRETAILQAQESGLTVQKEWADSLDHSDDEVTVQLYGDGKAIEGKTLTLNQANNWRASFTGLQYLNYYSGNPIQYTVEETAINGEPIDQLVKEGKYQKPVIEETQAAWEETQEVTEDRWSFAPGGVQDKTEYVLISPDNVSQNSSDGLALNHQLGINRLTYTSETFVDTDGNQHSSYFSGVTENNLWTTEMVAAPAGLGHLKVGRKTLALVRTGDEYAFKLLELGNENPGEGTIVVQPVLQLPTYSYRAQVCATDNITDPDGHPIPMYMSIKDSVTAPDGSTTKAGLTAVFNWQNPPYVYLLQKYTYQGEKVIRHAAEITITNEEIIPKKSMTVKKVWDDREDHSGDEVTVQLLVNGEPVQGQEITLSPANNWEYTFEDLEPVDENGNDLVYFVKETKVCGIPIEEAMAEGICTEPKIAVTKDSEKTTITKEVEVEKEYWVPATATNANGAQVLEDGKTYAIVSCNWANNNSHIAMVADHANGALTTTPLTVIYEEKMINGVTYDSYLNELPENQQWLVNVCYTDYNPNNEYNLYSFSNGDKKMALMGAFPNTYRFILTSKEGWVQEDMATYQTMLQLQSKMDYGNLITIFAGRIQIGNFTQDMWMYLKDGVTPAAFHTNQFAQCFKFYEKVSVTEKEEQQTIIATPSEVTITNKMLPPDTTTTDGDGGGNTPKKSPPTGDDTNVAVWIILAVVAAGTLVRILHHKRNAK